MAPYDKDGGGEATPYDKKKKEEKRGKMLLSKYPQRREGGRRGSVSTEGVSSS